MNTASRVRSCAGSLASLAATRSEEFSGVQLRQVRAIASELALLADDLDRATEARNGQPPAGE